MAQVLKSRGRGCSSISAWQQFSADRRRIINFPRNLELYHYRPLGLEKARETRLNSNGDSAGRKKSTQFHDIARVVGCGAWSRSTGILEDWIHRHYFHWTLRPSRTLCHDSRKILPRPNLTKPRYGCSCCKTNRVSEATERWELQKGARDKFVDSRNSLRHHRLLICKVL